MTLSDSYVVVDHRRVGVSDDGDDWDPPQSERGTRLQTVATLGTTFTYVYDFGDDWRHRIVVEDVTSPTRGVTYPRCIAGRRACPPEDCGGVSGYAGFLAVVSDPTHPEHGDVLAGTGGAFDPELFELSDVALLVSDSPT